MITVSATKFRNNLFEYLDKVSQGEIVLIQRNQHDIARLVPTSQSNWRDRMSIQPKLNSSEEELMQPLEDIWEDYV